VERSGLSASRSDLAATIKKHIPFEYSPMPCDLQQFLVESEAQRQALCRSVKYDRMRNKAGRDFPGSNRFALTVRGKWERSRTCMTSPHLTSKNLAAIQAVTRDG
jgi:hypothetical protein